MATPTTPSPVIPAASAGFQRPRLRKRTIAFFLGAYLGTYLIVLVPIISTLALRVAEVSPDSKEASLGVITGIGALIAMLCNPVIGMLSDRTTSRFGMRRPWIFAGAIGSVAGLVALAYAPNIFLLGVAWCFVQLSCNGMFAGLAAFLPDRVPESQRGTVSGLAGIAQQFSPLIGLTLANVGVTIGGGTTAMIMLPAILGLILVVAFVVSTRDRVLSPNLRQPFRVSDIIRVFVFNPRRNPDFGWAWLGRFFMQLSFAAGATYQVYFINARFGIPLLEVAALQLGLSLMSVVLISLSASVSGPLSDRLHRRKVFVFTASALAAISAILTAFSSELWMYFIAAGILGIASGAYFAVDLALVTDVLPDAEHAAAKDMGIFNIAGTLPQSLAPALAPLLLAVGGGGTSNYEALFLAAAVAAVLGALTVIPIKKVR
jgi:MFS family permease